MGRVITVGKYRVYVYPEQGGQHHRPHCHVYWPDGSCTIDLETLEILGGDDHAQARQIVRSHWGQITVKWREINP